MIWNRFRKAPLEAAGLIVAPGSNGKIGGVAAESAGQLLIRDCS